MGLFTRRLRDHYDMGFTAGVNEGHNDQIASITYRGETRLQILSLVGHPGFGSLGNPIAAARKIEAYLSELPTETSVDTPLSKHTDNELGRLLQQQFDDLDMPEPITTVSMPHDEWLALLKENGQLKADLATTREFANSSWNDALDAVIAINKPDRYTSMIRSMKR